MKKYLSPIIFNFVLIILFDNNVYASWDSPKFLTNQNKKSINFQRSIGDKSMYGINIAAVALSFFNQDLEGLRMFATTSAFANLITSTLKFSVNRMRPSFSDTDSFPSGHSTFSFSGAAYIYYRYGKTYGIPAYLVASYVGYTRVAAKRHNITDVLAGAAVSIITTQLIVSPLQVTVANKKILFLATPEIYKNYVGLSLNANL